VCARVRILIFHGYLLEGTGSNVYNARLAEALAALGHEVHLLSQERHPERLEFVDAAGDWEGGSLRITRLRGEGPARCTAYRPKLGGVLPVYVADRYEGIDARPFPDCSDEQIARYLEANVAAVREVVMLAGPRIALANHLVMGPVILARALRGELPYAVKVHGSALEYTVKAYPQRFLGCAREGLAAARAVLVGSRHTALSLWQALGDASVERRTRLGPPGVDVARFAPRDTAAAAAGVRELAARLRAEAGAAGFRTRGERGEASAFARDPAEAAAALERVRAGSGLLVTFVGKLIVSKGVDLLAAAWPLVLERFADAQLLVVGFGAYRGAFERVLAALAAGDLERVREIALAGRALEGEARARPLGHLLAFLDSLGGEQRERYVAAARGVAASVLLSGRLEHEELAEVLPASAVLVVPSTFPESFGMVAVEAAACGVLPVSAAHSGLAEVSAVLARAVPREAAELLSFELGDGAVRAIAGRLVRWLSAGPQLRARAREGLGNAARARWSWQSVSHGVIAAASGEIDSLETP
jgi:glycosyltransferase involved in cell wall biosynthesis